MVAITGDGFDAGVFDQASRLPLQEQRRFKMKKRLLRRLGRPCKLALFFKKKKFSFPCAPRKMDGGAPSQECISAHATFVRTGMEACQAQDEVPAPTDFVRGPTLAFK